MSSEHSSHTDETLLPGLLAAERMLWCRGVVHVAGIDEAGRGPLAGPVVAAAALFPHDLLLAGVRDSKVLREHKREEAYAEILRHALSVGVGIVEPEVIDDINILNATFRAMRMAVDRLRLRPDHLLVDGNRYPAADIPVTTIVGGDASSFTIAAASIVAKVTRDRLMRDYDQRYPGYGFARNKGYGTQEHRDAIERLGLSPIHRRSFVLHSSGEGANHAHRSGRGAPGPGVPHAAGVSHSRDEFPFPSRRD